MLTVDSKIVVINDYNNESNFFLKNQLNSINIYKELSLHSTIIRKSFGFSILQANIHYLLKMQFHCTQTHHSNKRNGLNKKSMNIYCWNFSMGIMAKVLIFWNIKGIKLNGYQKRSLLRFQRKNNGNLLRIFGLIILYFYIYFLQTLFSF